MSCHSRAGTEPANDPIDFSIYETTMIKRFIPLLARGSPERSQMYLEVKSGSMPISGNSTSIELEFVKNWILACAPKEVVEKNTKGLLNDTTTNTRQ